jgi:D-3-phosphoglycerate dehydrogenase
MRIALLEPLGVPVETIEKLAEPIRQAGHEFVYFDTKTTDPDELVRRSAQADVVMIANNPYPTEVIERLSRLKMIAVAFTGIDHVDLEACKRRGVMVCNCAGYSDTSVAELAVGLTISVLRKIQEGDAALRDGGTAAGLMGTEIAGKTVGIVGTGHIGSRAGILFKAFGARVLGYARHENKEATAAGIEYASLDELLTTSDIVSLHLPLNNMTRGSFDASRMAQMKTSSILINCARGPIVNTAALASALNEGRLAGAGVDVFDSEPPLDKANPLLHAKNCVLTPHVGFLTKEAMQRRAKIVFGNVTAWLSDSPTNVCKL